MSEQKSTTSGQQNITSYLFCRQNFLFLRVFLLLLPEGSNVVVILRSFDKAPKKYDGGLSYFHWSAIFFAAAMADAWRH